MLADKAAMATIAVRNIEAARKFYGEVLGLQISARTGLDVSPSFH